MALKDVEKDLHQKESEFAKREHDTTVYNVWQSKEDGVQKKQGKWQHIKDEMFGTRLKAVIIGSVVTIFAIVVVIVSAIFVQHQKGFFSQERVSFVVTAPQTIDSNTLTEIFFTYNNDNRAYLDNAQIIVQFGDYFVPEEGQENFKRVSDDQGIITIGKINGGEEKTAALAGHFTGPVNAVDDVAGILRYVPERTNTRYEVQARATTEITSSPLSIDMNAPSEIVSGNLVDIGVVIKNSSNDALSNIKLIFKSPQTFTFQSASPSATNNNVWLIDNIAPHSETKIVIRGVLTAPADTVQMFHTEVGSQEVDSEYIVYATGKYTPYMKGSPINIQQIIMNDDDGVAYAGDRLQYEVTFINNSDMPLRDAIASVHFEEVVLDFVDLQLYNGGDYDPKNKKITWKASDVPGLKILNPKDVIKVRFAVNVLKELPVESQDDYNFSVTTVAAIDSDDIPSELRENKTILSNAFTIPVGAKVIFDSYAQYKEGNVPVKVGEKTVYTITLTVDNINNDLGNTVVSAPLPTYVSFEGGDDVTFNERANEVVWDIGDIVHGAGVTSDRVETTFDVGIVPSVDQIDTMPVIVKNHILTAMDKFVGSQIKEAREEIITRVEGQGYKDGLVIP